MFSNCNVVSNALHFTGAYYDNYSTNIHEIFFGGVANKPYCFIVQATVISFKPHPDLPFINPSFFSC